MINLENMTTAELICIVSNNNDKESEYEAFLVLASRGVVVNKGYSLIELRNMTTEKLISLLIYNNTALSMQDNNDKIFRILSDRKILNYDRIKRACALRNVN